MDKKNNYKKQTRRHRDGSNIYAVYGTLKRGFRNHVFIEDGEFLGEDLTEPKFTMYDLGSFPGVVEGGDTAIHVELYRVTPEIEKRLDMLEGFIPERPEHSLYIKKKIRTQSGVESYIYLYNRKINNITNKIIKTGNYYGRKIQL